MRRIIISLIFSLLSIIALGQQSQDQSFYFKAGVSFPLFDLANGNLWDPSSGVAASGLHVEIGYDHPVSDQFSLGLAAEYYGNKYSHSKFIKFYRDVLGDASHALKTATAWSVEGLVLKPTYRVRIKKHVSGEIYGSGGFFSFFTPEVEMTSTSILNGYTSTYYQNRSKGISLAYGLGGRLNFMLLKTNFFLDADFMTSKFKYDATGTNDNNSFSNPVQQRIGYFSVNLGYTVFLK